MEDASARRTADLLIGRGSKMRKMKRELIAAILITFLASFTPAQTPADQAELTRLLNEFLAGAGRNDAAVHDRFWSEDLIYTRGTGQRTNKAEIMKGVRETPPIKPGDAKTTYKAEDLRIRQYGSTAVVAFRLVGTTDNGGKTTVAKFFNTGTFVKRKGKWQAVAWQATRIPGSEEESRDRASEADAEFHRALLAADAKKLGSLLDSTFLWTHATGQKHTREQLLSVIESGRLRYERLETNSITVNVYGDAAVVRGVSPRKYASGPSRPSEPKPFTVYYTLTLVGIGGSWKIVSLHTSVVEGGE